MTKGNVGKRQEAATGGQAAGGHTAGEHATEGCYDANPNHKPSRARGPPIDCGKFVQVHDDRAIFQGRIDELPVIDIHSL
jgi:hypothetical protein